MSARSAPRPDGAPGGPPDGPGSDLADGTDEPAGEVTVVLTKAGRTKIRYPARRLADDGNRLTVLAPWAAPEARDFGFVTFAPGDVLTEHYWRDRWYSVKEVRTGEGLLKGWYCDITRPCVVADGEVRVEDLDLDLWVSADTSQILRLDEDEFEESGLAGRDPAAAGAAIDALDALERTARAGGLPDLLTGADASHPGPDAQDGVGVRPRLRLASIALDCPDPLALAAFYQRATGYTLHPRSDAEFAGLTREDGLHIGFQRVDGHRAPQWPGDGGTTPQQAHLDFDVDDLDEAEAMLLELGAVKPGFQPDSARWRVLTDPAGHPFCIVAR